MTYSFSYLEPVCCSMSSSNCCFLTCIQISQEAGQVIWHSHLFQNFPQFIVIHTVKGFGIVKKAEISHVLLFATPWTTACQASLSITNSWSLLKVMSIELVVLYNHLILCRRLLLLPSIFPSIRVFSNESALRISWPRYWSFNFSISPSNDYSGLISFRMDWLDLFAVQGTLKSLLQHHSSKASILRRSAFVTVQLSHPSMITRKTIALTRQTFVGKVTSLLFNMLLVRGAW